MFMWRTILSDIAYAVGVVSRTLEKTSDQDVIKVEQIFQYFGDTPDYEIMYKNNMDKSYYILHCYSDPYHGGDLKTGRSTLGVLCHRAATKRPTPVANYSL